MSDFIMVARPYTKASSVRIVDSVLSIGGHLHVEYTQDDVVLVTVKLNVHSLSVLNDLKVVAHTSPR